MLLKHFPFREYKNIKQVSTFLEIDLFTVSSFSLKCLNFVAVV